MTNSCQTGRTHMRSMSKRRPACMADGSVGQAPLFPQNDTVDHGPGATVSIGMPNLPKPAPRTVP